MGTRSGRLLDDARLEASPVVANNSMNRERGLAGVNSYARELGFDPAVFLTGRAAGSQAGWLDLCCGSGRALFQAAGRAEHGVTIVGIDLVPPSVNMPTPPGLTLIADSVVRWTPDRTFDLITCVHGLHYIGDKLRVLSRAASWLAPDGLLVAHFDPATIRLADGRSAARRVLSLLRGHGFEYAPRHRRITRRGPVSLAVPARYLGADDAIGPGYTGQPAVASYYDWA
jgi:SAM-dependent methyltransferase